MSITTTTTNNKQQLQNDKEEDDIDSAVRDVHGSKFLDPTQYPADQPTRPTNFRMDPTQVADLGYYFCI